MYTLVWTAHFTRAAEKFTKRHPELKKQLAAVLRDLEKDPFQAHLAFHNRGGKLKGCQSVSLAHGYRITLTLMVTEKEIILLDIGSHDDVYR